jgi:hypothetical protein
LIVGNVRYIRQTDREVVRFHVSMGRGN